jgi:Flp pilus assembly protein protease CpaA
MDPLGFPHYYVLVLTAACAVTDIRRGQIYHVLTLPYHWLVGGAWGIAAGAGGLLIGVVPFAFAAARGWIGGGDVKLFGAVGALVGAYDLLNLLLIAFFLAALYGTVMLVRDEGVDGLVRRVASVFSREGRARRDEREAKHVRLGVFVFVAALIQYVGPAVVALFT